MKCANSAIISKIFQFSSIFGWNNFDIIEILRGKKQSIDFFCQNTNNKTLKIQYPVNFSDLFYLEPLSF